jgi:hypothetical protein
MNHKEEPTVTIPKAEYDKMMKDCRRLDALEGAGVDNWEGYDDAMEMMRGEQ